MSSKVTPEQSGDAIDVPLLAIESGLTLHGDGISTMMFFDGDSKAASDFLKDRLNQVAAANPWIAGNLVRDKKQHGKLVALRYSKDKPTIDKIFEVDDNLVLSPDMAYPVLAKAVAKSKAHVPSGTKLINKDAPVMRLTVAPCSASGSFVVIFSMSHTVGNGGTYYTLLNMLSDKTAIFSISADRKQDLWNKGPDIVGKKENASLLSLPAILNGLGAFIRVKCCCKKVKLHAFDVDDNKLKAAIEEAKALPNAPAKISMNDVLTSAYGNLVKPRVLTMAIDFRGKIEGLTEKDAGNYHSGLLYDKNGYATPCSIRESLTSPPPMSRVALPGCCSAMFSRQATITNWASMTKGDFDIPSCKQTLQLPFVDASMVPVNCAIVFKSGPGKTSMMLFAKGVSKNDILAKLPLGEPVSAAMFPSV